MQTLTKPQSPNHGRSKGPRARRGRFSPLMFIGIIVTLVIILGAGTFVFLKQLAASHAAVANADCTLIVPQNPLSAQGLATPYQLVATDPNNGPCNEATPVQSAFVQGAVFDPATGQISAYNPLVIDSGTTPAAAPVTPTIPQGAVIGLWFGFNGGNLTLKTSNNSLTDGKCVNGVNNSIFGQFAYCNAPAFFQAANQAIKAGKLVPPALGMAKDGQLCPTVRDFSIVDQDQSDNVTTTYLVTANGQVAQMNAANVAQLAGAHPQTNGSDNRLLAIAMDGALGCQPWTAPDLADPGQMVPSLPLNELQAAADQPKPVATIPNLDPMVLVNNQRNLNKLNTYRVGVDEVAVQNAGQSRTAAYCTNLMNIAPMRIALDAPMTSQRPSPDAGAANNLFNFLGQRFAATWTNLTCQNLTGKASPITVKTDANGVATETMINGVNVIPAAKPLNCSINGTTLAGCTGTTTINGQSCSIALDEAANQVNVTCPAPAPKANAAPDAAQNPALPQDPATVATPPNPIKNQ